jgi:hypothetical protein
MLFRRKTTACYRETYLAQTSVCVSAQLGTQLPLWRANSRPTFVWQNT